MAKLALGGVVLALVAFAACGTAEDSAQAPAGATADAAPSSSSGAPAAPAGSNDGAAPGPDASTGPGGSGVGYAGQHGALHVLGNAIVDAQGTPIQLRGMSLFWSQWATPFWNAPIVHTLATDWNATLVRAAVAVELGGYLEHPDEQTALAITVADAAIAEGIYVILDWHDDHADQHLEQAKTFFGAMAARYGNVPNVIFEPWNEPNGAIPWATVKTYGEAVIATVRAAGAQNLVVMGSPNWSSDADVAADDPVQDANTAYTLHFYAASHKQDHRDRAQSALAKGVALFATEWGTCESSGNGTVDTAESQRWLDFLGAHHVSWANWSLFDKDESCAALVPGASTSGPWDEAALTASGAFVHGVLAP